MSYSGKRAPIILIPFYDDAWRGVVSSGLLFILKERATTLVEAYSKIHEINYLMDSLRYENCGEDQCAYTQVYDAHPLHGIWIPRVIEEKIRNLHRILQKIKLD